MWTLFTFVLVFGQVSTSSVPGFTSLERCMAAGELIKGNLTNPTYDPDKRLTTNFTCVQL